MNKPAMNDETSILYELLTTTAWSAARQNCSYILKHSRNIADAAAKLHSRMRDLVYDDCRDIWCDILDRLLDKVDFVWLAAALKDYFEKEGRTDPAPAETRRGTSFQGIPRGYSLGGYEGGKNEAPETSTWAVRASGPDDRT